MITPVQAGAALLADVRAADPDRLHLWWLGQSGFLVAWGGRHLLLDPYLSDSLTRKYADTDKPHVRMTELVVEPSELGFVDVVTASHAHTDHLDPDTLRALGDVPLVAPEAHRDLAAERAGREPLGIDDGETVEVAGFSITAVPAAHEAIEHDDTGRMLHLGYVVRCGAYALYHAGDTVAYDDLAPRVRAVAPIDVALLPINGSRPERRVAGNLWGAEAAAVAHAIGARLAVPMHFEQFAFNTEPPDAFVGECERLGQPYRVLRAGERLTVDQHCRSAGTAPS
ncbi:MAG TPA: MBL fold metallo-hydrolase [Solirubrobacteraceae bacterium]|nr:MBL fold metallo-hydrolase [Solirubrobacteraceae bacterium]